MAFGLGLAFFIIGIASGLIMFSDPVGYCPENSINLEDGCMIYSGEIINKEVDLFMHYSNPICVMLFCLATSGLFIHFGRKC